VSSNFWSFADAAGGSSWNEYSQTVKSCAPLFISPDGVVSGKHLEAMREGVEDYEYLVMLDRAVKNRKGDAGNLAGIKKMLDELPNQVCAAVPANGELRWKASTESTRADKARTEILKALITLNP
jgi:hypothetical protein